MSSSALDIERRLGSGLYRHRDLALVRGQGCRVWDEDGREYLDATSMYGVASLGHSHPRVVTAIQEQAETLISCFSTFANDARARLLEELARCFAFEARFFLCNSGTEAVEAALKFARAHSSRRGIVGTFRGFHGRSLGALSATHKAAHRDAFQPLVPGFRHVPFGDLEALDAALDDQAAAFIVEAIQGEGGVHPASEEYLRGAETLCRERDVLLILDEVQCGFGRTGRWFGFDHAGIEPDLVCLAKGIASGMPLGAVAIGPRVRALEAGSHGSTFGGNPLACAAASATLQTLREERLCEAAAEKGAEFFERLQALQSPRIRQIRGRGLLIGVDLRERAAPFLRGLQQRSILALSAGPTTLRFLPPLVIQSEEIARIVESFGELLAS